ALVHGMSCLPVQNIRDLVAKERFRSVVKHGRSDTIQEKVTSGGNVMAGKMKSADARKKVAPTGKKSPPDLRELLVTHAPADDVAAYDDRALGRSAELVLTALKRHRPGTSVIDIVRDPGIARHGQPITAITVVNDNMPFLFDSVLGEVQDWTGEPLLVLHPVL